MTNVSHLGRPGPQKCETVVTKKNRNEIRTARFCDTSHTECSLLVQDKNFELEMGPNLVFRVYLLIKT